MCIILYITNRRTEYTTLNHNHTSYNIIYNIKMLNNITESEENYLCDFSYPFFFWVYVYGCGGFNISAPQHKHKCHNIGKICILKHKNVINVVHTFAAYICIEIEMRLNIILLACFSVFVHNIIV